PHLAAGPARLLRCPGEAWRRRIRPPGYRTVPLVDTRCLDIPPCPHARASIQARRSHVGAPRPRRAGTRGSCAGRRGGLPRRGAARLALASQRPGCAPPDRRLAMIIAIAIGLMLLAITDGACAGFRSSLGRSGLIRHRAADLRAARRGAALVAVLLTPA